MRADASGEELPGQQRGRAGEMSEDGYPGDRRRHRRFRQPLLCLSFDGRVFVVSDWSLGGFAVDSYAGALSPGSLFTVDAIGRDPEALTAVSIRSRVVRVDDGGQRLTANFLVIDMPGYAVLQQLIGERTKSSDVAHPTE